MCVVVDPPLFVSLFKKTDPDHAEFQPVLNWVDQGRGKFVYGGALYLDELRRVPSAIPVLAELARRGKIVKVDDAAVDQRQAAAKRIEPAQEFDDPHLVAIVGVSGCKLICVRDPRSHKFLRRTDFYNRSTDRPKLYTRAKNRALLCDSNICACCR
jgi:hypothetical protein